MKLKHAVFALALLVGASSRPVSAQYYEGYHASTVQEGAANGMANIIQSAGAANLLHSVAARNYEEARSRDIDNRFKSTQTYFEMKKLNREYADSVRPAKPTAEQMFRYAKDRAPARLGPSELDPLTGQITWPVVLEQDVYKEQREKLDALFSLWARYHGQIGPEQYLELQRTAKAMDAELKNHVKEYPPGDYVKAKSILESLAYEAGRAAG